MTAIAKRYPDADAIHWLNFRELYQAAPVYRIDLIPNGVKAADFKSSSASSTCRRKEPS